MSELMESAISNDAEDSGECGGGFHEIDHEEYSPDLDFVLSKEKDKLDGIIDEVNKGIQQENKVCLNDYPPLYVVHYRGTHFYKNFFEDKDRQEFRMAIRERDLGPAIYSPAVYDLSKTKFGYQLPHDVDRHVDKIRNAFTGMKSLGPVDAFWQGGRKHANLCYQHYQRFVNNFKDFVGESAENIQDCYKKMPSKKNPYVATADSPNHAILYALGGKSEYKNCKCLRPEYRESDGGVRNPEVGSVQIILHTLPELIEQEPLMLSSLHAYNAIDINTRRLYERETCFKAYIPKENVVASHMVCFPSFSVNYDHDYHTSRYGLESRSYAAYGRAIKNTNKNPAAETGLMDKLAEHYSYELEQHAKQLVRERNGYLVYLGLDGQLHSTLPLTSSISNQRIESKRNGIMDTPLYGNLEFLRPQSDQRSQG